jgi:hypothetical protein
MCDGFILASKLYEVHCGERIEYEWPAEPDVQSGTEGAP